MCLQELENMCVSPKTPLLNTRITENAFVCGAPPSSPFSALTSMIHVLPCWIQEP